MRLLCKPEGFIIPTYKKISSYRHQLVLSTDIEIVKHIYGYPVGAAINYNKIISITTERIVETIGPNDAIHYPLTVHVADGLDGSGSHKVYNQIHTNIDFSTKCFILFAFKILKVISIKGQDLWTNDTPNSPFVTIPIALISLKENRDDVEYLMRTLINSETYSMMSISKIF